MIFPHDAHTDLEKLCDALNSVEWDALGFIRNRTVEILKEIAEAFGVSPHALEMVERDDLIDSAEIRSSEARVCRNGELADEVVERSTDSKRYRKKVKDSFLTRKRSRK